jgi:hypothetical protein
MSINYYGFILGLVFLITTGLGHILVIKGEYHFGLKIWPLFLIIGSLSILLSFIVTNTLLSGVLGVLGVTFLWGILELFHQRERVRKGWFPKKTRN